jgi:hypothetical protein
MTIWAKCGNCGNDIFRYQFEEAGKYNLNGRNKRPMEKIWFCNTACLRDYVMQKIITKPFKCYPIKPFGQKKSIKYTAKRIECANCHAYIPESSKFCSYCGAPMTGNLKTFKILKQLSTIRITKLEDILHEVK